MLKCRFCEESFWWHQLDLHKGKFYKLINSWGHWVIVFEWTWRIWKVLSRIYTNKFRTWLMANLSTQALMKTSLFKTNKVLREITVTLCRLTYQAEAVSQFTANLTRWSCVPIRFKLEIVSLWTRMSKRTVAFTSKSFFKPIQLLSPIFV